jgi:Fe-S cluster assembly protein SufD
MGSRGIERMSESVLAKEDLERAVAALPANELTDMRQVALKQFHRRGFPAHNVEDWKYTDLSNIIDISQRWLASSEANNDSIDEAQIQAALHTLDAAWIVIANGRLVKHLSTGLDESGVDVSELSSALATQHFDAPLSDLNAALLVEGFKIQVSGDKSADRPIGLLIADNANAGPLVSQTRVDIEVDESSAARVVEYHISGGEHEHYSNTHINLTLREHARTAYVRIQNRALHQSQTQRLNVWLAGNSHLDHGAIDLGGCLSRNDLHIDILGRDVTSEFNGLYLAGEAQHIDNHTRIDHRVGPATSSQEYRGILAGRCRCVWNGKAIVHKGADGSDATQANHNLLLSENAEIDAKPELEIYADEVKCAHGTTVGQLDEKALIYLRSRGLDEARARRILTRAFAASIVSKLPIQELQAQVGEMVECRLIALADGDPQ